MSKVAVYNMEGAKIGDMEVSDSIFAVEVNKNKDPLSADFCFAHRFHLLSL